MRRCTKTRNDGAPYAPNRWHDFLMDTYANAAHAWWLEAEAVAIGYATELGEYKLSRPHPQLKDFMVQLAPIYRHGAAA